MKLKSEALDVFQLYKLQIENQFQTTITRGYRPFVELLNQCDTLFGHSCLYTHHQNGLVESKYRQVVEALLLAQVKLPLKFWSNSMSLSHE